MNGGKKLVFGIVLAACVACMCVVPCAGNAIPLNFNQLPEQFKEFVPDEVTTFYKDLTDEDKAVLKELAGKHATFANEDEALAALKNKSPKLHAKAEELRTLIKGRIDTLNPEAKTFVNGVIEKLRALKPKGDEKPNLTKLRDAANEVIKQYKGLSDPAKESLKTTFPKIAGVIQNEKFQKLASGLLKTDGAAATN